MTVTKAELKAILEDIVQAIRGYRDPRIDGADEIAFQAIANAIDAVASSL